MPRMERIIACTDLSRYANWVETRAAMLADELGNVSLDLLHVVRRLAPESLPYVLTQTLEEAEQRLIDSSRDQVTKTAARFSEKYGIQAVAALKVGRIHSEVARHAEIVGADLVILGAQSGDSVRKMFLGSTAENVLRKLTRPVLIVKQEPKTPYRRILVAVDFSESSRRAMDFAKNIASRVQITALHAFETPYEAMLRFYGVSGETIAAYHAMVQAEKNRAMEQFVSASGAAAGPLCCLVEFGPAADIIRQKAETLESDLIVIGKHGQSEREEMLLGSVTKQIILNADCDVLVISEESSNAV